MTFHDVSLRSYANKPKGQNLESQKRQSPVLCMPTYSTFLVDRLLILGFLAVEIFGICQNHTSLQIWRSLATNLDKIHLLHTKCGYISFPVPLECIGCPGNFPPCSNLISRTSDYHRNNMAKPLFIPTDGYWGDIFVKHRLQYAYNFLFFFFFCDWYDLFVGNRFCSVATGVWYVPWVFVSIIDIRFVTVSTWDRILKSNIIVLSVWDTGLVSCFQ